MTFAQHLSMGAKGEELAKAWLIHYGHTVISDFGSDTPFQGPRAYTPSGTLVQPDLLAIKPDEVPPKFWVEVKTKRVFSWSRNRQVWVTGIDLDKYLHYLEVSEQTDSDVLIVFLHLQDSSPKYPGSPWPCPVGLFWQWLDKLEEVEAYRYGPMVYWSAGDLERECSLDQLEDWWQQQQIIESPILEPENREVQQVLW
tara:strand:- start:56 stop:649 length:594 start_codon:yes stop_codon:yes gene_type:complete